MMDALDRWLLRSFKAALTRGGSPERIGRGVASGVFAAFFPLSALRFVVALLATVFFRGNRVAAFAALILCNFVEFAALSQLPSAVAVRLWKGGAEELAQVADLCRAVNANWSWLHPVDSLGDQIHLLTSPGYGADFAWAGGSALVGGVFGVLVYPLVVVAMSYFYDAKIRAQQFMNVGKEHPENVPLVLPPALEHLNRERNLLVAEYCGKVTTFQAAEGVRLLVDGGQAFPEMLAAIAGARETLVLETYIFRADKFGNLFAEALVAAGRRGVKTRVVVDGFGSVSLSDEFYGGLTAAGIEVRIYHPLAAFWRAGLGFLQRRDHRKILVADGRISLIGGLNIADEYASVEDGGGGWRDTHVRIDGQDIAAQLIRVFDEAWRRAIPAKVEARSPSGTSSGPSTKNLDAYLEKRNPSSRAVCFTCERVPLKVLSNHELIERMRIKRTYLCAIDAAQRYVLIENAFFIPDRDMLNAMYRAAKRGVVVAIVVAMKADIQVAAMASRALYDEMLVNGLRLYEYPLSMIHSKVAVIDDIWSIVSSYNLNQRSLLHDLEVGAMFFDESFAVALRDQILEDIGKCNEITKLIHRARPWNIALLESFCYLFRYWM